MALGNSLKVTFCRIFANFGVAADVETIYYEFFVEGLLFFRAIGCFVKLISGSRIVSHEFNPISVSSFLNDFWTCVGRSISYQNKHVDILL